MSEQQPQRKPFHEALTEQAQAFAKVVLNDIPELESIAIVFSYGFQSPNLPFAVVLGQNGELRQPVEIMHMSQQLAKTWNFQMQSAGNCITNLDDYMQQKSRELKQLQDQINDAKQQLESSQPRNTGP